MKNIGLTVIVFMLLGVACNNSQSKKTENDTSAVTNLVSEKPIIKKVDNGQEKEIVVKEILTTSPRYKQLTKGLYEAVVKNGGLSYGLSLEGSPNPKQNKAWSYSKTYDFAVYERYTDRRLNTARFTFNPNDKQLYEYDVALDQLKPIEFDKNLLLKYEALCK